MPLTPDGHWTPDMGHVNVILCSLHALHCTALNRRLLKSDNPSSSYNQ